MCLNLWGSESCLNFSHHQAAQYVAPSSEATSAVNAWLQKNNITATSLTPAGDWLGFEVPVSKANDLFGANYSIFTHESTGKQTIRTLSYSIPEELTEHVEIVYPTVTLVLSAHLPPNIFIEPFFLQIGSRHTDRSFPLSKRYPLRSVPGVMTLQTSLAPVLTPSRRLACNRFTTYPPRLLPSLRML